MDKLGDDVLGLILKRTDDDPDARKSLSLVCKQWYRVEGLHRLSLRILEPANLQNFLPRFPNLLKVYSSEAILNSQINLLAKMCPNLEVLNLNLKRKSNIYDESDETCSLEHDFDDCGLSDVAMGCRGLKRVHLRSRVGVSDGGVVSLVNFARALRFLDLSRCGKITDKALEVIGCASSLEYLNLQGCCLITDNGLSFLTGGPLSCTLKELILAECDRITDFGLVSLKQMCCLQVLNLADCGPRLTDVGGVAIAEIQTLISLNLSWLINVSDVTLASLAQNCKSLETLNLTGCELVTNNGVRALTRLEWLLELRLADCANITVDDLEEILLEFTNLEYIVLDIKLFYWIPKLFLGDCRLEWM